MKYLCLVYLDEKRLDEVADSECKACGDALRKGGHAIAAEALQSVHSATTVRVRNGNVSVTDGPFRRDEGAARRLLPHRRQGLERSHPAGRENPSGARGQHRGAPGQGIIRE